jgi:glycine betaine catabolism B
MRIRLRERRSEAPDVMSFVFDLMGQPFQYLPGQYVYYELDELRFPDERGKRRHFTISSSPTERGILMFTTRMRGSGFKETLRQAALGYELTVEQPLGSFVLREGETRRQIFIAGGIGVTPYRSILRHAADTGASLPVLMLHFSRSSSDLVFRRELEGIARLMSTFSLVPVITGTEPGWTGEQGDLDEALLRRHVPDLGQAVFWISGPPPMVRAFEGLLQQIGISEEAIRTDTFIGY